MSGSKRKLDACEKHISGCNIKLDEFDNISRSMIGCNNNNLESDDEVSDKVIGRLIFKNYDSIRRNKPFLSSESVGNREAVSGKIS